eukprot:12850598-Alexandrium_andersonii.AAC.1
MLAILSVGADLDAAATLWALGAGVRGAPPDDAAPSVLAASGSSASAMPARPPCDAALSIVSRSAMPRMPPLIA